MTTQSKFYYPVTVHQSGVPFPDVAPFVTTLPSPQSTDELVAILSLTTGDQAQGVYVFDGTTWKFAMPMLALSASIIRGDTLDFYVYPTSDTVAAGNASVYKNGILQADDNIAHGQAVYSVRTPPSGGGGGGAVDSVNGQTGNVTINAINLPGLSVAGRTGQYNDLLGLPGPYILLPATSGILGGVVVPNVSNLSIDGSGNIDLKASLVTTINSKLNTVVTSGTGISLVRSITAGNANLKSIAAGTNVGIVDDGAGTLTVNAATPTATSSVLGGIKVGAGLAVAGDGTLSNAYALPIATASTLGGVKQGTNITIAGDGTISATAYTLPQATAGILGGVKVGAGLAVAGDGTLSVSSSYTLPQASPIVLGGIKVGTTLSIAGDGTLDANLPVAATASVIGLVKPGVGLTVAGDGTLSASAAVPATASTLGNVKIGSGVSVAGDGTISVAFPVSSVNTKTGAVSITAGNGVTVNNGGANIVVALNLASSDVTTALGYTPYNGATNPNGYLAANQNITYTGDATGSGTTNVALTLANSGVATGTFTKVTVDAKGRVTVGANPTTLAGYNITDALNSLTGGSIAGNVTLTSGATITGVPTPVNPQDVANRSYVDAAISGVANGTSWRQNGQVATTANIALTGLQTIDGYAVQSGDRVLAKNQTNQTENGVYVAAAGAWSRAVDTDTGAEILGMAILILNGTAAGLSQWINTNTSAITIGSTNITFTQLQAPMSPYSAGTGLTLTTNQFSITNTGVIAGTYSKVTVNAQGQVTTGAQLASSDITTALGFTPYNATNPAGYISANQNVTVTGDATGSGTTAIALTLANTAVTPGVYKSVTVDSKGRITAGTNPTTLAGFGITDGFSNTGGNISGTLTMTSGATVTGLPTPVGNTDAANKSYTDAGDTATFNSVAWKILAQVTTTANIALTGLQTIDGYAVQAGDRVLVKDQTTATQNGVYVAAAGAWARATDVATGATIKGMTTLILNGTTNILTLWANTNAAAITVGTTNVTYAQVSASSTPYTAGIGLTLAANQFSITNTGVAASTFTKVTVNAQGQVTAGTALTSGDVTTALGFTPLSANQTVTLSGDVTGSGATAITATLANTAVTPGAYGDATHIATFTVDGKGRLTAAGTVAISAGVSSVFGQTGAVPNLSGDATTTGSSVVTLANSGVGAGTYSKVTVDAKGRVTVGAQIASSDVTTALTYTPVNKAGDTLTGTLNGAPTVNVTAAATAPIGAAASNDINMLGTTTITAFDTAPAGAVRTVRFTTILTLTHVPGSLVLPGAANITTANGDVAEFSSKGGGNWVCNYYSKVSGAAVTGGGVASVFGQTGAVPNLSGDVTTTGSSATTLANSGVSAGTYTKVTVDAKGRVTVGASISNAEINAAIGYTPVNKAGDTMTGAFNQSFTVNVSSAATTLIGAATSNDINILGTVTITAFDSITAGAIRNLNFVSAGLTLTHNAGTLILPGAANIITAAGDQASFVSKGGGVWVCSVYTKANGTAVVATPDATKLPLTGGTVSGAINEAPPVSLASAGTVNIGAAAANSVTVTGTTTITAFDTIAAGAIRRLTFSGILTLTHNAASLILPSGANVTTGAGDVAEFASLGGGNWRCTYYTKAGSAFATLAGNETLTNKTLTNDTYTGFIESGSTATGSAFSPDFTTGTDFEYTTNANTTITLPTPVAGRSYTITVIYGGVHTIAFAGGGTIKYAGNVAPGATSVAGKRDYYVMKCDRAGTITSVFDGGRNY